MRLLKPLAGMQVTRYQEGGPDATEDVRFTARAVDHQGRANRQRIHQPGRRLEQDDGTWLVVASKSSAATHPGWLYNPAKHPDDMWLEVGYRKLKVEPTLLKGKERHDALARIAAISPRYGEYQTKTDREIPIVRLKIS